LESNLAAWRVEWKVVLLVVETVEKMAGWWVEMRVVHLVNLMAD
jgi:hypothetical protein